MTLPKSFTTVTPYSKALAAILFISLPFLGFYLGTNYQKKIDSTSSEKIPVNTRTAFPTPRTERCENERHGLIGVTTFGDDTCLLTFPLHGYKMNGYIMAYPEIWEVKPRGASGVNLFFDKKPSSDTDQHLVFMSSTVTSLPLEKADQETQFGAHENFFPTPTIDQNKQTISRNIETIGDKKVLHVITENKGISHHAFYFYYDKKTDENKYMSYVISASDPDEELLKNIEYMIKTLRFIEE
jgi:hypothetical protein